jgi:hypothetical protein
MALFLSSELWSTRQARRFVIPVSIVGIGGFLLSFSTALKVDGAINGQIIALSGLVILTLGTATLIYSYLQDVRGEKSTLDAASVRSEMAELRKQINKEVVAAKTASSLLQPADRDELLKTAKSSIEKWSLEEISKVWKEEFQAHDHERQHLEQISRISGHLVSRLQDEVFSLGRRANINLAIGASISAIGLIILTLFIYTATSELSSNTPTADVALRFLIRLSLAGFIQLFAYFFLRLYRYSLFEIKYFQNELTGAEFRVLALFSVIRKGDKDAINKIALELVKSERNFILKKGESTVALQREVFERDYESLISKTVESVLARKGATHDA